MNWSITFGSESTLPTFLPLLPALSLPYGWLTAAQLPQSVNNGLEWIESGRFNATVEVDYGGGHVLLIEHRSEGFNSTEK